MFDELFPNGVTHYLAGGAGIGAAIGMIYLLTGRIAGISSFFSAIHSWWSHLPFFQQRYLRNERTWKSVLVIGLIVGAAVFTIGCGEVFTTEVQWWRLLIGGVLVGFGTRTARGCTSGHGICGISSLVPPSIAATLIFMGVAIITAHIVAALGVTP